MPKAEEDLAYWKVSNGMIYVYVISVRYHYSK